MTRIPLPDPAATCQAFLDSEEFEKAWERFWGDLDTLQYSYSFEDRYATANVFFQKQGGSFQYGIDLIPRTAEEQAQVRKNLYLFKFLEPMEKCFQMWWYTNRLEPVFEDLRFYREEEGICVLLGWRNVLEARLETHAHLQARLTKLLDALGSPEVAKKAGHYRIYTMARGRLDTALECLRDEGLSREQIDRMYAECMGDVEPEPEPAIDPTLSEGWDISEPALFGKFRYMRSLAVDDQCVVLYIEVFPGRGVRWHVSPPDPSFEDTDFAMGSFRVNTEVDDLEDLIIQARRISLENYDRWQKGKPPTSTEYGD